MIEIEYRDLFAVERRGRCSAGRVGGLEGYIRKLNELGVVKPLREKTLKPPAVELLPRLEAEKPRRVRRPSLREVEKQAGRPVTSLTVARDGSRTYAFSQSTSASDAEINEWDRDLGTHPPQVRQ